MGEPEDSLLEAADAIVDAAWPLERQLALRRMHTSTVLRWSGAMTVIAGMATVPHLAAGAPMPWEGLGVIGLLAAVASRADHHERAHLDRPAVRYTS